MKRFFAAVLLFACLTGHAAFLGNEWNTTANSWQARVVTAGGGLSGKAYMTGTRFVNQLAMWGLRTSNASGGVAANSKVGRANLYIGNDLTSMLCPTIIDWTAGGENNDDTVNFVGGDYSETSGLTGNTTSKYLRPCKGTGLALASFTDGTSLHLATYNRSASAQNGHCMGLSRALGTYILGISVINQTYACLGYGGGGCVTAADTNGTGFCLSTRINTTNCTTYRNSVAIITDTTTYGTTLSSVLWVHAIINSSGSPANFTDRTLAYYGAGFGITTNFTRPYQAAVENVQTAMGRKVP